MNFFGEDGNLDRARIKKLLAIGLFGSVITGVGDFLIGYAAEAPIMGKGFAEHILATAPNLPDWQIIAGSLLGVFGLVLEGLCFFAIYRLMVDAAPCYARVYRAGIFGYLVLAPIGCHMNVGVFNLGYKYFWQIDPALAAHTYETMYLWFCIPLYVLLALFWIPMIVVQFKAFGEGRTPYPRYARWFNLFTGAIPALLASCALGMTTPLAAGIGTMFLSWGNMVTFGGLLAALPSEKRFEEFRNALA